MHESLAVIQREYQISRLLDSSFFQDGVSTFINLRFVSPCIPRRRWEDNIKMDLQEVGGGRGDWMELAQDRDRWRALVGTVRDFWVP